MFQSQRCDEIRSVSGKMDVMAEGELAKRTPVTRKAKGKKEREARYESKFLREN